MTELDPDPDPTWTPTPTRTPTPTWTPTPKPDSARIWHTLPPMPPPKSVLDQLLRAAAEVRKNAYAPYSKFPVGAAVLADGRIHAACNVENSSFPLGVCAERNAVAMAVAAGATRIDAVAVVGGGARPSAPCGGCRQVIAEFAAPEAPVLYATPDGEPVTTTIGALLPAAFGPEDLKAAEEGSTGSSAARAPGTRRSAARGRASRTSGR
ncbi:MAG TPA: cytidine deaminase [Myxococcales bacterium]|nr:cytidine deaminase [Myxococcales bacterium]